MNEIGIIGLGVMGKSIAYNFINNGFKVIGYNRTFAQTEQIMKEKKELVGVESVQELVVKLHRPRKVFLMVPAGGPADQAINKLLEHLDSGDIIIDGGNSFFKDTHRRFDHCKTKGVHFFGLGVSGGEEGALKGPSMMLGGDEEVSRMILPLFTKVAAQTPEPCIAYLGEGGAGHFVKMIHNGVEYAEMQAISELYLLLKEHFSLSPGELTQTFKKLYESDLSSYLLEITVDILQQSDDLDQGLLIDKISDNASSKGTGRWTVEYALQEGVSASTISAALDARILSSQKELRESMRERYLKRKQSSISGSSDLFDLAYKLLFFSKMVIYTQGVELLLSAKKKMNYSYDLPTIFKIWRNGCIIRSSMLDTMASALEKNSNLLLDQELSLRLEKSIATVRTSLVQALEAGIATPVLTAAFHYFEMGRAQTLPTRLVQAQRDYFGAHTYERIDREGTFHTQWEKS